MEDKACGPSLACGKLRARGRILPGDEIVQVNEQVVVSRGGRGLEGGAGFGSEVVDGELQGWEDLTECGGCG